MTKLLCGGNIESAAHLRPFYRPLLVNCGNCNNINETHCFIDIEIYLKVIFHNTNKAYILKCLWCNSSVTSLQICVLYFSLWGTWKYHLLSLLIVRRPTGSGKWFNVFPGLEWRHKKFSPWPKRNFKFGNCLYFTYSTVLCFFLTLTWSTSVALSQRFWAPARTHKYFSHKYWSFSLFWL